MLLLLRATHTQQLDPYLFGIPRPKDFYVNDGSTAYINPYTMVSAQAPLKRTAPEVKKPAKKPKITVAAKDACNVAYVHIWIVVK